MSKESRTQIHLLVTVQPLFFFHVQIEYRMWGKTNKPIYILVVQVTWPVCFLLTVLASKSSLAPAFLLMLFKVPSHLQRRCTSSITLTQAPQSRSRQSGSSRITDEQISDLVSKLQDLLPEARLRGNDRVPSSRVLQETCSYIRSLHREVDDLSERLSELLATSDMSTAQAAVIRSLLM
ncbi:uncharacterized protein LOC124701560 isoform X1 [Lolium rigidum]|uniref:uncharacterized protein LOC124701560 isoform X1 n=1 Tax=Lolium rigidum TaxID=89674 RepID=UPI001F5CF240|nr:uncharacterized protein LOC124701560 isoform X1 [Lolium rigidum]XP_047089598.1 uncharacterized protein LOC124701560 isoform X1 [Lolium rigidum]